MIMMMKLSVLLVLVASIAEGFVNARHLPTVVTSALSASSESKRSSAIFDDFVDFLKKKQLEIIQEIEEVEKEYCKDATPATFSHDAWGSLSDSSTTGAGGITRVLQGGCVVEKGACSLTVIELGILQKERATTIRGRTSGDVAEGDDYAAAALSLVMHTANPNVPTFRSDVRIFSVQNTICICFFGTIETQNWLQKHIGFYQCYKEQLIHLTFPPPQFINI